MRLLEWFIEPNRFKKINGWLTVFWFLAAFPICIFLSSSIPLLVFISVYAVVMGHASTWQATRVEVRQEDDDTQAVVKETRQYLEDSDQV